MSYESALRTIFQCIAHAEGKKFSYLPCRHTNTHTVQDGMTVYFSLKTLIRNKASRIKCTKI
jgi:hypothetical protein